MIKTPQGIISLAWPSSKISEIKTFFEEEKNSEVSNLGEVFEAMKIISWGDQYFIMQREVWCNWQSIVETDWCNHLLTGQPYYTWANLGPIFYMGGGQNFLPLSKIFQNDSNTHKLYSWYSNIEFIVILSFTYDVMIYAGISIFPISIGTFPPSLKCLESMIHRSDRDVWPLVI